MLDAVIGPLNVTAGYVDRISKGDIPPKITDTTTANSTPSRTTSISVSRDLLTAWRRLLKNEWLTTTIAKGWMESTRESLANGGWYQRSTGPGSPCDCSIKTFQWWKPGRSRGVEKVGARSENDESIAIGSIVYPKLGHSADYCRDAGQLASAKAGWRPADASKHQGEVPARSYRG